MYRFIGISFFVGFASMGVLMLFTICFTKIASKFSVKLSDAKDLRIKVTEEIFNTIQFIKINALEKYFYKKVNQ
jgi:ABC-type bacteriocin/lantibiotic exporter with double-glycine peptidase domain